MTVPLSLIRRQNHVGALSAIGVPIDDTRFPAITQCPACRENALKIFFDAVADGLWFTCEACQLHGNIVTFAAQLWNMGIIDAVKRFAELGFVSEADVLNRTAVEDRLHNKLTAAEEFWADAQSQLWNHGDDALAIKIKDFGLSSDLSDAQELAGVAHKEQVRKLCETFGCSVPKRINKASPYFVLKFEDMPNRISGFLLTQYEPDLQAKQFFAPTFSSKRDTRVEAGYYRLQNAFTSNDLFKGSVFVMDDPFWVLRAQTTQLKYGLKMLPVCGSYASDRVISTGLNWPELTPAPKFFYSKTVTPETVSQACLSRGYVTSGDDHAFTEYSKPLRATKKLFACRRNSTTWKTGLETLLADVDVIKARAIAKRLLIQKEKLRLFFDAKKFPQIIMDQILAESPEPRRQQLLQEKYVIERDGQWYLHSGRHVCDGIIRVTHVFQTDAGDRTYRGFAVVQDRRIEFTETEKNIQRLGLLKIISQKACALGIFFIYDHGLNSRAHLLAMQLDKPQFVPVSEKIGWCDTAAEFRFPNFSITNTGEVVPHAFVQNNVKPFPEPTVVGPLSVRAVLTPAAEHAALWAGIAAIISNIVAPISRKNFVATAVPEDGYFDALTQIGEQLNCPTHRHVGLSSIINLAAKIDWPHIADAPYDKKRLMVTIARHQQSPLFLKTLPETALAATTYGWNALVAKTQISHEDVSFLPHLLPQYVQHILKRRMVVATTGQHFLPSVLTDMHAWLRNTYGSTFNLETALSYLWTPDRAAELIMQFLAQEIETGRIDLIIRPRRADQDKNYVIGNKEYWWINERALNKRFSSTCGLLPDWSHVRKHLDTLGVFLGQNTIHNTPGFNVTPAWAKAFVFRENKKIG